MSRWRHASPWLVVPVLVVAAMLLSIGINRDYRLKHEDNNAMHATFARNHLELGLDTTRAHDAYVNPGNGRVRFYAHHPPVRIARGLAGKIRLRPVEEVGAVFLAAGAGYLVVFNWGAWQHHYWQFPLLPAVVIALALAVSELARRALDGPRRTASRVALALLIVEVVATSTVGLYARHSTPEDRVIKAVETFRSRSL